MGASNTLICGYYGHYNWGDEAMLTGLLRLLRPYCPHVTVYSAAPDNTQARHGVKTLSTVPPRRRLQAWRQQWQHTRAMLTHRCFVLGGGDLLRDSPTHEVAGVWLAPLQQAVQLGHTTLVLGISVGDIWKAESRQQIPRVLNRVSLIAVRDQISRHRLIDLGVRRPIQVMPDLALQALPPTAIQQRSQSRESPQVGLSLRSVMGRGAIAQDACQADRALTLDAHLQQVMATIADTLIERHGATIHLVPFQAYPAEYHKRHRPSVDDHAFGLVSQQLSRYPEQWICHPYIASLDQLLTILQSLDLMIGTRLHSLILAAGSGVPAIAIEYDPKVSGFMAAIDQTTYVHPLENLNTTAITTQAEAILTRWPQAHSAILTGLAQYNRGWQSPVSSLEDLLR
ncbi:hypothetical protein XM38_030070 [Halomicronema hongdechloris C2206]|uniref:Polysaccharide pyruvyl transferase domain-containing protein n=1 Tax=Halomicronema hongdechloris C2206 TaxID=1641165 RepID=A0A1Z3HP15_9CYAN|nr:polysaccharide pyruvyl transferase family protein [Halomicronema hongdechloris]ASC72053.1 hypothetical protein XM38_030070 [Halomicronema hongdechloris C2206]